MAISMKSLPMREQMQAREFSLGIRFNNFTEVGTSFRFKHPQFLNSVINQVLEQMFREIMPPIETPTRCARLIFSESIRPTVSATMSSNV